MIMHTFLLSSLDNVHFTIYTALLIICNEHVILLSMHSTSDSSEVGARGLFFFFFFLGGGGAFESSTLCNFDAVYKNWVAILN